MTHICVSKLGIIGSNNGLSPGRRQAIIWPNVGILLIRPLGTNFNEILIESHIFSFKKMKCTWKCRLEMAAILSRPQCVKPMVVQFTITCMDQLGFYSPSGMTSCRKTTHSLEAASLRFTMIEWLATHWGRDKMVDISQTTLSNAFPWMKIINCA